MRLADEDEEDEDGNPNTIVTDDECRIMFAVLKAWYRNKTLSDQWNFPQDGWPDEVLLTDTMDKFSDMIGVSTADISQIFQECGVY